MMSCDHIRYTLNLHHLSVDIMTIIFLTVKVNTKLLDSKLTAVAIIISKTQIVNNARAV